MKSNRNSKSLMVRMDEESKRVLERAAMLRRISVSDYVRTVTVPQAQREIDADEVQTIALSPAEQLTFWQALNEPAKLTTAQQQLGQTMRGKQ